jgi:hypothetical protein
MATIPRTVDAKGRITLGKAFANQLVIVSEIADGIVRITRAKAVPEPEIWLHKNPDAIRAVMEGIDEARRGNLVDGPDLDAMGRLSRKMGG